MATKAPTSGDDTVAVVLSGAAARGAFQAGALAEIIPALEDQGVRPTIWLGTSAGSINAALWAAALHRGSQAAAEAALEVWSNVSDDNVFRPILPFTALSSAVQFAAGALFERGPGITSLLDTTPLQRTAEQSLNTEQLAANVGEGLVSAVGVTATRMPADSDAPIAGSASGRSALFLDEQRRSSYDGDSARALDVLRTPIIAEHVMASSAIPVAFPPVQITRPERAAAWYVDGGVRLNTPLHPAIGLGANRIVCVSATALTYGPPPAPRTPGRTPDIDDAAAQVLHSVLADQTTEDLGVLLRTNRLVRQANSTGESEVLRSSTGKPYREIEVLPVAPPADQLGRMALDVFERRTNPLGWLRETDNWLIGRMIRGAGDAVGRRELLSYLFFDEEYFQASIELGRETARRALADGWIS